ncbi:hypothetical protein C8J57DRAFT_1719610 [Mycena rebaudengoi]|nr:hypothetical protein C8J57DRAFT_1719610 [Mycena rebaudengoi]
MDARSTTTKRILDNAALCLFVLVFGVPVILGVLCCGVSVAPCGNGRRHHTAARPPPPPRPRDPPPLPTRRIDIRQKRVATQARKCYILNLPAELRQLIFEMVLGRRLVEIELVPNKQKNRFKIRAICHQFEAHRSAKSPNYSDNPSGTLPVALLRTCRQIYLEGLPRMHQSNTFYFTLGDFAPAILGGLGLYCLPDIRMIHICLGFHYEDDLLWDNTCRLLGKARLDSLILEFHRVDEKIVNTSSRWCRSLLRIRGLRSLSLVFRCNVIGGHPMQKAQKELSQLMIGPGADERYSAFLERHGLREDEEVVGAQTNP